MADLLTLRMNTVDKKALTLSSHLSDMPVSRLIMPFMAEGTRTVLGSTILHHIDRSGTYDRRALEMFTNMIMESSRTGSNLRFLVGPEDVRRTSPKVVWDFFDIVSEANIVKRMNEVMEEVRVRMGTAYVSSSFLRYLCYRIGDDYVTTGGSLDRFDYHQASEIFFTVMLERFYHHNAEGTADALHSQFFIHQGLFREFITEMMDRYNERTRERKLEAIEVQSSTNVPRGRPPKQARKGKVKRSRVVAREL